MADETGGAGGSDPSPDEAIDGILRGAPDHVPGTRPIHAPGIVATGRFQASEVASGFSSAAHFSGQSVPVTVRFSNGTGSPTPTDSDPLVRGMAVRFHPGRATAPPPGPGQEDEVDLVAMTLPIFFARDMEGFMNFVRQPRAGVPRQSFWKKFVDTLYLRPPPERPPTSGELAAVAYANDNPEARYAIVGLSALSVPESYVTCAYHPVHAYLLTAGDDVTAVRFRWEPVAGVRPAKPEPDSDPNYLQAELRKRLAGGPAEFVLRMQVAEQGDDTSDTTTPWPERRRRVVMGLLRIDAVVPEQEQEQANNQLDFNPTRMVDGIGLSDDQILHFRRAAYERSAVRRQEASPG